MPDTFPFRATLAILVAAAFGVAAYRVRWLSLSGALAASGLAWMLVALGGVAWAVSAVTFFVSSSGLSRWGRGRKRKAEALAEKGSRRDAGQVIANGGVGALLLALYAIDPHPALYWGFVGAFAAAAADTWGTEIGTAVRGPTRLLAVGPRVSPGTSGGMSAFGTLGALLGATVVVASAVLVGGEMGTDIGLPMLLGIVIGGGGLAALLDSLLGATVQARYRLPEGTLTERRASPDGPLPLARGVRWIGNDAVNLVCTTFGGGWPLLWLA